MYRQWSALLLVLMAMSFNASAEKNIYTGWFSNKAVSGYDTVAYFEEGKAVKGEPRFKYEFQGVEWYFSNAEYLELFKNNPDQYMPQYGGFCAWAVAVKKKRAPGDPNFWKVVDGKLYLNYDRSVQDAWLEDVSGFIKKADKNWPDML